MTLFTFTEVCGGDASSLGIGGISYQEEIWNSVFEGERERKGERETFHVLQFKLCE